MPSQKVNKQFSVAKMARKLAKAKSAPITKAKAKSAPNTKLSGQKASSDNPPSSPLKALDAASSKPFNKMSKLSFERRISADLPQTSLFDIFSLFCPRQMVDDWVQYTNARYVKLPRHAEGPRTKRCRQNTWKPTSADEIYLFLGILIYMTVFPVPRVSLYWDTSSKTPNHPIARFMSRDRFQLLYRNFCTWDTDADVPGRLVFDKIHEWDEHVKSISTLYWRPASEISVDEAMIRFTGRSPHTVHLPSKPIPLGYKVWVVADSGYFLHWSYHAKGLGPIGYNSKNYPDLAPTQGIVADLLATLPPPPSDLHEYHATMDNLFTTPELLDLLRRRGIAGTGTARIARIDSRQLAELKAVDAKKDFVPWGTLYARQHKVFSVMQLGFKDNAFVPLLSTRYDGSESPVKKLRRQPAKTSTSARTARVPFEGQSQKVLPIPKIIDAYNHHMNGVDIGDQLRAGYQSKRRNCRGGQQALMYLFLLGTRLSYSLTIPLFANMIEEVVVTNSYLLHRHGCQSRQIRDQGAFRTLLYEEIFRRFGQTATTRARSINTPQSVPVQNAGQVHSKVRREKRGWCAFCSSKRRNLVLDEAIQKVVRKKSVFTGCLECDISLCTREKDCWERWHSQVPR